MEKMDPTVALQNLSAVRRRVDSLQRFLSESVNSNTFIGKDQMEMVSAEISSAIHSIILNGAALLACTTTIPSPPDPVVVPNGEKQEEEEEEEEEEEVNSEEEVVEIDAVELLAEHVHFCEICGKGFKRDANLRMHMRAHGNQFKTPQALAKPLKTKTSSSKSSSSLSVLKRTSSSSSSDKFSCPYKGCNRNKKHENFRPLKSVVCVRNHFKRSHCPKMYLCERCNKKSFSVLADLKSHLKHCGESRWICTCGTSFSRKDKLFGHVALFEGHMPAVVAEEDGERIIPERDEVLVVKGEEEEEEKEDLFLDGLLLDGFGSIVDGYCLQDVLGSPNYGSGISGSCWGGVGNGIEGFYGGNFGH